VIGRFQFQGADLFRTGPSRTVEVSIVPAADADDGGFVAQVVDLVNRVYADAEHGLWLAGADRTNAEEVAAIVRAGELAVARLDGQLVGAIRIQRIDGDLGEFGMLVASPEHRGVGIGRELVAFAEGWARGEGLARMQLELLVPQTWTHPAKAFLHSWYTRLGYERVRTGRLDEAYPALQPQLATPCDFAIYHKDLPHQ
jgi:GNAT superfamily N-acetyltransferase